MLNIDNPVFKILTRMFDVMLLNILWLICSIPIITLGASTTALYYSTMKIIRKKDYSITGMFFHSFRQNLKQGSIITGIFVVIGILLGSVIQACSVVLTTGISEYIMALVIILLVIFEITISYTFPLLAQFENTTKNILINAFVMGVRNLRYTSQVAFLNAVPLLMIIVTPEFFLLSIPIWMTFGVALIALFNAKIFVTIFDKYLLEIDSKKESKGNDKLRNVKQPEADVDKLLER